MAHSIRNHRPVDGPEGGYPNLPHGQKFKALSGLMLAERARAAGDGERSPQRHECLLANMGCRLMQNPFPLALPSHHLLAQGWGFREEADTEEIFVYSKEFHLLWFFSLQSGALKNITL